MAIVRNKKKKVSKKLKISWRKHVNIDDVEEFLEEKRLEERLGPELSTVSDDKLFVLDTKPQQELLSSKERRKLRASRPVNCFSILEPHTKVPDPIAKRNRVRTKEERKHTIRKKKEEERKLKGILRATEIQSLTDRRLDEIRRERQPKKGEFNTDLWTEEENTDNKNEWVVGSIHGYYLRDRKGVDGAEQKNLFFLPVKRNNSGGYRFLKTAPKSVQGVMTSLSSVEPPHPGMSYNPSLEDHQELLKIITEKEQKRIKQEEHLQRVTHGMFSKVKADTRDEAWLVEMAQGLPSQEGTITEENGTEDEYKAVNPPVKNKKKTLQQRRKQKEQLEMEKAKKKAKLEKKKIGDIHKLKDIQKEIGKTEEKQKKLNESRKKAAELKKYDPKRLSSTKFEEADLDFNMMQDISGNLRNLHKEGNLLFDRFKSMQKRNILEPSKRRTRKKSKVKKFVKADHKEESWMKTVAR